MTENGKENCKETKEKYKTNEREGGKTKKKKRTEKNERGRKKNVKER